MILPAADRERFPRLARWLRREAPKLARDPAVVDTMVELVGIEPRKVREALAWNRAPTVKVVADLVCKSAAAGCFRPAIPEAIEIEQQIVEDYERKRGPSPLSTGRHPVPKPGIVLLHELVHWADYAVDGRRTEVGAPYHDIGSKWEWLVFGVFLPEMQRH